MKKLFRILPLLICLCLCFAFAGCGEEEHPVPPPQEQAYLLGTVKGTLTENGEGLKGVTVTAGNEQTVTDAAGAYSVKVYEGGNELVFEKQGYFTQKKKFSASAFYTSEITFDCIMFVKTRVSGTVTEGGAPAAGAVVKIGLQSVTTGEDGSFVFPEVIGTSMILTAEKGGKRARKALYTDEMRTGSVSVQLILE